jgi:RNA polymerase sigma factor (sigma-70 family)
MAQPAPVVLDRLLRAADSAAREEAWADLVGGHNRLLLKVASARSRGYDETMDRYAYVLEKLREQDYRRLRTFEPALSRFTTWLVAVARRLCTDFDRERYGRFTSAENPERVVRRSLVDLVAAQIDDERLGAPDDIAEAGILAERDRLVGEVLAELPPDDRLLLKLRYEDGLSVLESRGVLGLPTVFHVYRRLRSLHAGLRQKLARRGVTSSDG